MRKYNSYYHFMGKCERDKEGKDLERVQEFIFEMIKKNNWDYSFKRDITEETHITFSAVIFFSATTTKEQMDIYNKINKELEKNMFIFGGQCASIGDAGFTE